MIANRHPMPEPCSYCGGPHHDLACPRIAAIDFCDGSIVRIELHTYHEAFAAPRANGDPPCQCPTCRDARRMAEGDQDDDDGDGDDDEPDDGLDDQDDQDDEQNGHHNGEQN